MRADERELLADWSAGFAHLYGTAPTIAPLASPVAGAPSDLFAIAFPPVFEPDEMLGGTGHFARSPAMVEHVRRLGFDWNVHGRIVVAPTPSTFNALLPLVGEPDAGYPLAYRAEDAPMLSPGPWLLSYLDGRIPIHVGSRDLYTPGSALARRTSTRLMKWHFTTLAHDLTVHALNYHLVPKDLIADLGARIRAAVPERIAPLAEPGARPPLTLSFFYDNDLNRYCYEVWFRCDQPRDFARVFTAPGSYAQLVRALDLRIAETRAGKGDVRSQDTRDMAPLEPFEFNLGR